MPLFISGRNIDIRLTRAPILAFIFSLSPVSRFHFNIHIRTYCCYHFLFSLGYCPQASSILFIHSKSRSLRDDSRLLRHSHREFSRVPLAAIIIITFRALLSYFSLWTPLYFAPSARTPPPRHRFSFPAFISS